MCKDWLFSCLHYRNVMLHQLETEGQNRGYRTLMAQAAGCQLAYLSQVLSESAELTPEHASGLCDFWEFSELESEYFLTLVYLGRSSQDHLRTRLLRKLDELRQRHESEKPGALQIERQQYQKEKALLYYLDWVPSAVHLLLMVPGFNSVGPIARRLRLPEAQVLAALRTLAELGIASREEATWTLTARTLHVRDESLFAPHHHRNWREKAVDSFRPGQAPTHFHFTSVYSLDRATLEKIRDLLAEVVASSRRLVLPASEQTIACLNIDWFEIA